MVQLDRPLNPCCDQSLCGATQEGVTMTKTVDAAEAVVLPEAVATSPSSGVLCGAPLAPAQYFTERRLWNIFGSRNSPPILGLSMGRMTFHLQASLAGLDDHPLLLQGQSLCMPSTPL